MSSCRSSNRSQSSWNFSHAWRLEARSQPLVRRTPPTSQKSAVISPTHRLLQHLKTPGKIFAQMDAQRAPVPLRQNRSEEHTSELQSRLHLVCRLLLEKKNDKAPSSGSPFS